MSAQIFHDQHMLVSYPDKKDFYEYEVYRREDRTISQEEYEKLINGRSVTSLEEEGIILKKIFNQEQYQNQLREYYKKTNAIEHEFKDYLFKKFDVELHPKREDVYLKAYEHGHASGFSEIECWFADLVDIIR